MVIVAERIFKLLYCHEQRKDRLFFIHYMLLFYCFLFNKKDIWTWIHASRVYSYCCLVDLVFLSTISLWISAWLEPTSWLYSYNNVKCERNKHKLLFLHPLILHFFFQIEKLLLFVYSQILESFFVHHFNFSQKNFLKE